MMRRSFHPRGDASIALLIALAAFATRALFIYRDGMPDPDALMMAAGTAIDQNGDLPSGDALLYGRHVSPGYSFVVGVLYPLLFDTPRYLVAFLNWSTAVFSSLTAAMFYGLARGYLSRAAAVGAASIWVLNAVAWESGTYFHTVVPCTFLLLVAMALARRVDSSRRGVVSYAATAAVATAAFLTRTEIAFVWPALIVWTLTSKRMRRDTLLLLSISIIALAAYACVVDAIGRHSTVPSGGIRGYVHWYASSFSPRGVDRTLVWAILSLGAASIAAILVVLARERGGLLRSARARLVLFGCAWVVPSTVFWMLAPVPILRHYYLATVGVAWLVGVLVLDRPRRTWATAIVVAVLNLALPEAAYTAFRMRTGASKTPHGTFFSAHRYWAARVDGFVAMRDRSAACWDATATPSTFALVTWEGAAHVLYRLGISERRVRRIAKESIYPGVDAIDLDYEGGRLRLVQYVYFEDPVLRARVRAMVEDARAHGECIVFPAELGDALGVAADDAANLVAY